MAFNDQGQILGTPDVARQCLRLEKRYGDGDLRFIGRRHFPILSKLIKNGDVIGYSNTFSTEIRIWCLSSSCGGNGRYAAVDYRFE